MNKHAEHIPGLVKYAMDRMGKDPNNPGFSYYRNPNTGKLEVLRDRWFGAGYDPTAVSLYNAMNAVGDGADNIDTTPKQQAMLDRYAPTATGQPTKFVRYADPSLRNINTDSSSAVKRYQNHPANQTRVPVTEHLNFWGKPDLNQARSELQDSQTLPVFRAYNKSTNFRDRIPENLQNKSVFREWEGYGDLPEGWGYYNPHTILQDQLRRDGKLGSEEALNVQQIPFLQSLNQRHAQNLQGNNGWVFGDNPHNLPWAERTLNSAGWWGSGAQGIVGGAGQVGHGVGLVGETPRVYVDHQGNLQYADASGYMKHGLQNVGLGAAETALAVTGGGAAFKPAVGAARKGIINKLKGGATDLGRGTLNFGRKSLNVARHPVNTTKNYWKKTSPLRKGQHAVLADEWGSSAFGGRSNMEKLFGITGDDFNDSGESSTNPMSMGFAGTNPEAQQAANPSGPINQEFQPYVVPEEFRKREAEIAAQQAANYVSPAGAPLDVGNPFAGTLSAPSSYTDSVRNNLNSGPIISNKYNWAPEGQDPQVISTKGRYYHGFLGDEMDAYTSSREAAMNARKAKQFAEQYAKKSPEEFAAAVSKFPVSDSYKNMLTGYHAHQSIPDSIRDPNWQPEYVTNLRDKYNSRFNDTNVDPEGARAEFWDNSFALGMGDRKADKHWFRDPSLNSQPIQAESVYKYNQQNPSHGSRFYPISQYNFITPSAQDNGTSYATNPGVHHESGRLINPYSETGKWDEGGVATGGQFTESRWDPKTKNWAPHIPDIGRAPIHSGPEDAEAEAFFQPKSQVDEYQRYLPAAPDPYGQGGTQVMHNPNQ